MNWSDGTGGSGGFNFASGYDSPNLLDVGTLGVKVSLMSGKVNNGNTFTMTAGTPRDTLQYTINCEPFTEPIVVVLCKDPQGNHRFMIPAPAMDLSQPTDNLVGFAGQMLQDPGGLVTDTSFVPGTNTNELVVNNLSGQELVGANLFLNFVDAQGQVFLDVQTGWLSEHLKIE